MAFGEKYFEENMKDIIRTTIDIVKRLHMHLHYIVLQSQQASWKIVMV